jgi:hypothetical protein
MKGNDRMIARLNDLLADELTAINQYMVHSEMCDNWGYEKLHGAIEDDVEPVGRVAFAENGGPGREALLARGGEKRSLIRCQQRVGRGCCVVTAASSHLAPGLVTSTLISRNLPSKVWSEGR